jgi:hypothetical protein
MRLAYLAGSAPRGRKNNRSRTVKMICAQAKTTALRDKAIEGVISKYPELQSKSMGV